MDKKEPRFILLLGATSAVVRALANELASQGYNLVLAGRDTEEVERIATDIQLRYQVRAHPLFLDVLAYETHGPVFENACALVGGQFYGVVAGFGYLGVQAEAEKDRAEARKIVDTNYTAAVSLLGLAAEHLEKAQEGFILGIASVAGDRGRQSNYLYGSAKGAFAIFLQGLRVRLAKSGVNVTTLKPGFVDTKMTFGLPGLFLVARPEDVAVRALKATYAGQSEVYAPWFWGWIMWIIRWIPDFIFRRLKL